MNTDHDELQRLNLRAGYAYALSGLWAVFLSNSAGLFMLLSAQLIVPALHSFSVGMVLAIGTFFCAYASQMFFASMNRWRLPRSFGGEFFRAAGIGCFVGSAYAFLEGLWRLT